MGRRAIRPSAPCASRAGALDRRRATSTSASRGAGSAGRGNACPASARARWPLCGARGPCVARVVGDRTSARLPPLDVPVGVAAERGGRRGHHARIAVRQVSPHGAPPHPALNGGQRPHGRRANVGILVVEHALDGRQPAQGDLAAGLQRQRSERARTARRLVMQQQRRDQMALVERLEEVDRVEDTRLVRVGQLLDQRFDGRQVRVRQRTAAARPRAARCCGGTPSDIRLRARMAIRIQSAVTPRLA